MNSPSSNAGLHPHRAEEAVSHSSFLHRLSLVLYPDPVLRTVCQPVETFDSALRDLADEMLSLMRHHSGIGLAGPQVGLRQRLIVASIENCSLALANLEVKDSTEPREVIEGCLSLPDI